MDQKLQWLIELVKQGEVRRKEAEAMVQGLIEQGRDAAEVVLSPTEDGGYLLIGAVGRLPPVFSGMRWSHAEVLQQTLARLDGARSGAGALATLSRRPLHRLERFGPGASFGNARGTHLCGVGGGRSAAHASGRSHEHPDRGERRRMLAL